MSSRAWRRTTPRNRSQVFGQSVTLTMPGLVLEGQEDRALGGHRVLPGDDQAADPHPARIPLREDRVRHRPEPLERRPEQPHDLALGIQADDRVRIAQPLRLGDRGEWRGGVAGQAQVHRPAGGPSGAPLLTALPSVAPATSRSCHSSSRRGRPSESSPPTRTSRSTTSSGQAGPLDDIGQALVRPPGELLVEPRLVLLADPLDEAEAQPDPVVRRGPAPPSAVAGRARTGRRRPVSGCGSGAAVRGRPTRSSSGTRSR